MKRFISVLLAMVMMISIFSTYICAEAAGWSSRVTSIDLNTWYCDSASYSDYQNPDTSNYSDAYKFEVPAKGTITVKIRSTDPNYFDFNTSWYSDCYIMLYNEKDLEDCICLYEFWRSSDPQFRYNSSEGYYYANVSINLSKGTYYLRYIFEEHQMKFLSDEYDICIGYKPSISKPTNFKVVNRNANSLKLSWSKVGNVSGYQLQRKIKGSFKKVANTNNTSYTVKNLNSATNYIFRVRAYKVVSGKKYYSSWEKLTTPTKPTKVSIKTPETNRKHQIVVKWKTVTRASGYQVQYCKNSRCSNVIATKTVSNNSKTSYTGNNFTKGRKYYVRVRAYKKVNGKKYYGKWSAVKSIVSK